MLADAGLVDQVYVDSAGTHADYHPHAPPDSRGQATALRRGVDLSDIRARLVAATDFAEFDHILAMDRDNYQNILALDNAGKYQDKVRLMCDFCQKYDLKEVPDPYYGGPDGFDRVIDLLMDASEGLLEYVITQEQLTINN